MGSAQEITTGKLTGCWEAHFRDVDGRTREHRYDENRRPFKSELAAEKYANRQEALRDLGEGTRHTKITFGELAAEELDNRRSGVRRNSIINYQGNVDRILRHPIARRPPKDAVEQVRAFTAWLTRPVAEGGGGFAPRTACSTLQFLRATFALAADRRYISHAQLQQVLNVKKPRIEKRPRQALTYLQVCRIAAEMPPDLRAILLIEAGTGMRIGEILARRPRDITWPESLMDIWPLQVAGVPVRKAGQGWVKVYDQLDLNGTGERVPWVKTDRGYRDIPMGPRVARVLWDHMQAYPPPAGETTGTIFWNGWWPQGAMERGELGGEFGRRLRWHRYGETVRRRAPKVAADDPDWPTKRDGRLVASHALRHHWVTALDDEGVPLGKIAKWAGDTPGSIVKTYLHDMPDRGDRDEKPRGKDVDAIERVWEAGEREQAAERSVGNLWGTGPAQGS